MSTISDQITNAANATEQAKAAQPRVTGAASSKLDSNAFLMLMMKQLQYQDPLSPVDNKEFIAQQAQFSQLQTTQEMNNNIATNNSIMQSLTLVGKQVTLTNPDDPTKTITGVVSEAKFTSKGTSIVVNDKEYPISLVQSVTEDPASSQSNNDITSVGNNILQDLKALPNLLAKELKNFLSSATSDADKTNTENNTSNNT